MFLSPNYRLREARGCDTLSNRGAFRMLRFGGPPIVVVLLQIIQQTASTTSQAAIFKMWSATLACLVSNVKGDRKSVV